MNLAAAAAVTKRLIKTRRILDPHSKTVLVIAGPTAVGKTAAAIDVALRLGTEILSADSRQCYHGMAIGSARPSEAELRLVPHHFIDAYEPATALNAADYERIGLAALQDIFSRHDTAVVCGGTGLYIRALCEGLDEMPPVPEHISQAVQQAYEAQGLPWLQQAVAAEDPLFYKQGEVQNPARMLRALAFVRATGSSILAFRSGRRQQRPFRIIKVALELPRPELYARINRRVDAMMQSGLLEEVHALYPLRQLKNLQTVGYSELFDYLDGRTSLEQAVSLIAQHTRNYAKRQLTWLRKDPAFHWLQAGDPQLTERILALLQQPEVA